MEKKIEKAGNLELLEVVKDINWLLVSTPLKNMKVKWDYYSQYIYMESHRSHVPNHQAVERYGSFEVKFCWHVWSQAFGAHPVLPGHFLTERADQTGDVWMPRLIWPDFPYI